MKTTATLLGWLMALAASTMSASTADGSPGKTQKRPNILILLADDLGYGDVQCYNPQRGKIATPHIDRLAAEGMRFTDAHSSSSVCSPSRYTLLTGRYHWRTRLQGWIVPVFGALLITPERLTVAGLAKQHGDQTAAIGKWHLGWDWPITKKKWPLLLGNQGDDEAPPSDDHLALWQEVFSQKIPGGPTAFLPKRLAKSQRCMVGPALKDWSLEAILPTLGDRASEFISGKALYTGAKELKPMGHYSSGPLRGYKTSAYEGGSRLPFIVRWPGQVTPGSLCGQFVHQADVMATVAEILGAALPANAGEDSVSILSLLRGGSEPVRQHSVSCSAPGVPTIHSGDRKLILNPLAATKEIALGPELYSLAEDIGEKKNLVSEQLERVASMTALYEQLV